MEFREEVTQLLKEGRSWKEINEIMELTPEEITSIAAGRADYASGEEPLFPIGEPLLFFVDEEEYYFGEVTEVLPKKGSIFPEYQYRVLWKDGLEEILYEQQVMDGVECRRANQWLL